MRRTREYLETTIDPETGEPYLKPVRVELFGERPAEAISLPPYLQDAYTLAEEFCHLLAARIKAGFLKPCCCGGWKHHVCRPEDR